MPKLTQYTRQVTPTGQFQARRASAEDFGGDLAFGQVSSALGQASEMFMQKAEREESLKREKMLADDRVHWATRVQELQKELPHGGLGIEEVIQKEMQERNEGRGDQFVTRKNQIALDKQVTDMMAGLQIDVSGIEATAQAKQEVFLIKETLDTNMNLVRTDPTQVGEAIEQLNRMVGDSGLSKEMQIKVLEEQEADLWLAAVGGQMDRADTLEQVAALRNTVSKKFTDRLTPAAFDTVMDQLNRKFDTLKNQRSTEFMFDFSDRQLEVAAGIGTDSESVAADMANIKANVSDPKRRAKFEKKYRTALAEGEARNVVKNMNHVEKQAYLQALSMQVEQAGIDEPGGTYTEKLARLTGAAEAIGRERKMFEADPVGYTVKRNSDVRKKQLNWKENPTPETLNEFVLATSAAQIEQGVHPRDVAVLDPTELGSISAYMRDLGDSPQPGDSHVKLIQLADKYGKHWPKVQRQLQGSKVLTSVEAIAASMDSTMQMNAAKDLLVANDTPDEHFGLENFGKSKKDTRSIVLTKLAPLDQTLMGQVGGGKAAEDHTEAVTRLALYYQSRLGGRMDMDDAVNKAASEVILDYYKFSDDGYRIPVEVDQTQSAIEAGARLARNEVDLADIVPDVSLTIGIADVETRRSRTISAIRNFGKWVTNGDESGLQLVDANGAPVLIEKDGIRRTVERTWSELGSSTVIDPVTNEPVLDPREYGGRSADPELLRERQRQQGLIR